MDTQPKNSFRKAQKINRKSEIDGLFKAGRKWRSEPCSIYYSENTKNRNRCIVVVKKDAGSAVVRNRQKRCIRELFRCFLKNTSLHFDILVKVHPIKDVKKSNSGLRDAVLLWYETVKK